MTAQDEAPRPKWPGDSVANTDPVAFAMAFVTAMRREKGLSQLPSLRTTLAIPRFLSARWFRLRALTPRDYCDAAVLCTPSEDQAAASRVAREILFPKEEEAVAVPVAASAGAAKGPVVNANPTGSILDDLAGLDIDLDALGSLGDVDQLLDQAERGAFRSFDLYESLHASADPVDTALGRLIGRFGGAPELEANAVVTRDAALEFAREKLRAGMGALVAEDVADGCAVGFGALLLTEAKTPWELAGAYAGTRDVDGLGRHLDDVMRSGTTRDIGRTLKFMDPHAGMLTGSEIAGFREAGLRRARDLSDHAELLDGLGRFIAPAPELVLRSAVENVTRALEAARWIERAFNEPMQERVFGHWADAQVAAPALDSLVDLTVPCARWEVMVDCAYADYVRSLTAATIASTDWN